VNLETDELLGGVVAGLLMLNSGEDAGGGVPRLP
jgi:hypothetical protein